ncbi:MAG: arsenate reductase [Salibacteraceae bacterium]
MKKIYQLSTCKTCQRILAETGTDGFEVIDLKQQNISADDLELAREKLGSYEALFNRRAIKYRKMGLHEKHLSDEDYRDLILKEYTFLKRPLYIIGNEVFAGNSMAAVNGIKRAIGVE